VYGREAGEEGGEDGGRPARYGGLLDTEHDYVRQQAAEHKVKTATLALSEAATQGSVTGTGFPNPLHTPRAPSSNISHGVLYRPVTANPSAHARSEASRHARQAARGETPGSRTLASIAVAAEEQDAKARGYATASLQATAQAQAEHARAGAPGQGQHACSRREMCSRGVGVGGSGSVMPGSEALSLHPYPPPPPEPATHSFSMQPALIGSMRMAHGGGKGGGAGMPAGGSVWLKYARQGLSNSGGAPAKEPMQMPGSGVLVTRGGRPRVVSQKPSHHAAAAAATAAAAPGGAQSDGGGQQVGGVGGRAGGWGGGAGVGEDVMRASSDGEYLDDPAIEEDDVSGDGRSGVGRPPHRAKGVSGEGGEGEGGEGEGGEGGHAAQGSKRGKLKGACLERAHASASDGRTHTLTCTLSEWVTRAHQS
jgi:hypothetical protein